MADRTNPADDLAGPARRRSGDTDFKGRPHARNNDPFHSGGAPTGADAPDDLLGYASREDLRKGYQAEHSVTIDQLFDKPVQSKVAQADAYANSGAYRSGGSATRDAERKPSGKSRSTRVDEYARRQKAR